MSKTAIKKENFKKALQLLAKEFNAHNFEHEDGGRKVFFAPNKDGVDVQFQIDRESYVGSWDDKEMETEMNNRISQVITPIQ